MDLQGSSGAYSDEPITKNGDTTVAVQLTNLVARSPKIKDLEAVTELIVACEIHEHGISDYTVDDLRSEWHRPSFNLETDAWVVLTVKGQPVGYASVWHKEHEQIHMFTRVHPQYRRRGIGTLLVRLAEQRARLHVQQARPGTRVTLSSTVSSVNEVARQLLEREGYAPARQFWRIVIEMDELASRSNPRRKLKVDLDLDSHRLRGATRPYEPEGLYVVRPYATYEKELRPGEHPSPDEAWDELPIVV
jgi:GNAT superfamily N-acetyltransferase